MHHAMQVLPFNKKKKNLGDSNSHDDIVLTKSEREQQAHSTILHKNLIEKAFMSDTEATQILSNASYLGRLQAPKLPIGKKSVKQLIAPIK
jgi:hypothetical protein